MVKASIEKWITDPLTNFLGRSSTSGIILFASAICALILANSPWAEDYHHLWHQYFTIGFDDFAIRKTLHHWINDGLMAVFFFVIGLELKREIMAGELSTPKDAILPVAAGIGGMLFPALIYLVFNSDGPAKDGWGIPMATDIAFALGILFLLGKRVPLSLKVFLTALAIADDIGAVLVIAFFYTSSIDLVNLGVGVGFMALLVGSNLLGIRNTFWFGLLGIGGLWTAFLMSGIHATIAAVLAAFTIPANVKVSDTQFVTKIRSLLSRFENANKNDVTLVTPEQLHILEDVRHVAKQALTPLQRLEHIMHPMVAFVVMPVFAFANAGITFPPDMFSLLLSPITLGVIFGLLGGKVFGVFGMTWLMIKFGWATLPKGTRWVHILGIGMLASVGFTMSLFVTGLAFETEEFALQAKLGILTASLTGGILGYFILRKTLEIPEE
jgi:NhaA family Na+:H+ antiporter